MSKAHEYLIIFSTATNNYMRKPTTLGCFLFYGLSWMLLLGVYSLGGMYICHVFIVAMPRSWEVLTYLDTWFQDYFGLGEGCIGSRPVVTFQNMLALCSRDGP
jgi:hypothetical protein